MFGYFLGRTLENNHPEHTNGFSTFKFVAIAGSISLLLFGTGYALYGLGSALRPISDIVDEFHDSNSTDSSDETSSTETIRPRDESSTTESISDTDDAEESA